MKRIKYISSIILLLSFFISCNNKPESGWQLDRKIEIIGFSPVGISNFKKYIAISDSSQNLVYMIDTTDLSIFKEVRVEDPVYINIRRSKMLIPSYSKDTVFLFRGSEELYPLESHSDLNGCTSADATSIWHYAQVSQNEHVIHYRDGDLDYIVGGKGTEYGKLITPSNVMLVDSSLYVVDSGNKRIQVFDKFGEFDFCFGEEIEFVWPTGIAVSETEVFISDAQLNEIVVFDHKGKFLNSITEGIDGPSDIEYFEGKLYVANLRGSQITILTEKKQ